MLSRAPKARCHCRGFLVRLTVVICTHNPRPDYFEKVISGLHRQTLPKEEWELVLIDNASDCSFVNRDELSWHPNCRYLLESKLGLAYARQRGIEESHAAVIVFVDDDNVLDANYLTEVVKISEEWPHLGTWGAGIIVPEYDVQPTSAVQELLGYLALRNDQLYPCTPKMPWGAGLCIRANVALAYNRVIENSEIVIVGRRGNDVMACDDKEMTYTSRALGFGTAVFPQLRLTHLIPRERVTPKYLLRLYHGDEMSSALLEYKWNGVLPQSPFSVRGLLSNLKNALLRRGLRRARHFTRVQALMSARSVIAKTRRAQAASFKN